MQQGGRTSTTYSVECNSRLHEMLLKGLAGDFRKNFHNTESPGNIWLLDFTGTFKITSRLFIYLSIYLFSYLFIYLFIFSFIQPVDLYPPNEAGFCDVFGNVWEWLEDHFNGLPGFETDWLYDDYSSSSFDGRHRMIMVRTTKFHYHIQNKQIH